MNIVVAHWSVSVATNNKTVVNEIKFVWPVDYDVCWCLLVTWMLLHLFCGDCLLAVIYYCCRERARCLHAHTFPPFVCLHGLLNCQNKDVKTCHVNAKTIEMDSLRVPWFNSWKWGTPAAHGWWCWRHCREGMVSAQSSLVVAYEYFGFVSFVNYYSTLTLNPSAEVEGFLLLERRASYY